MNVEKRCSFCGHPETNHQHRETDTPKLDDICWECEDWEWAKYHAFQLDNLKYIEDVAKEKGLI